MFSRNGSGITGYPYTKKKEKNEFQSIPLYHIYKKKISTWIIDLTVKTKIIKYLEKKQKLCFTLDWANTS